MMLNSLSEIDKAVANTAERITKDSGEREINEKTGFNRDTDEGKPKFSEYAEYIIPLMEIIMKERFEFDNLEPLNTGYNLDDGIELIDNLMLNRLQGVLARGADKYGADNWRKGNKLSRSFDSVMRHAIQWFEGDTSEDHLAGMVANIMFLMRHEREIQQYRLPEEFGDIGALANE